MLINPQDLEASKLRDCPLVMKLRQSGPSRLKRSKGKHRQCLNRRETFYYRMSFNAEVLRSASDDLIPSFLRAAEDGTTTAITHQTFYEFGKIGKGARIINNDAVNNLDVRLHDPLATVQVVPPNSELVVQEWFGFISCTPDGVTGSFQLTIEVANLVDAQRLR